MTFHHFAEMLGPLRVTPRRMAAAGLLLASLPLTSAAIAQGSSPLGRVQALGLETAEVGRVTAYFAPDDREHAERLAGLSEEAAAYFERTFGASFPLHLGG